MTTPPEHPGWAGLTSDLLTCVFQLLDSPSRICFRAVCRLWRAAVQDKHPVRMPPPWVVIPGDIGCSKSFTLLSIPTQQGFRWTPPGGTGLRYVGSNGGWLAGAYINADRTLRISLVNPLIDTLVEVPVVARVSFTPHHEDHKFEVELALSAAVQKVVFSPNPTEQSFATAVVGVSRSRVPASFGIVFARAGCEGWCAYAKIQDQDNCVGYYNPAPRLDVAYHTGKFYYMTTRGQVWVVDMAAMSPSPALLARFKPTLPGRIFDQTCYHLAISSDGALHVVSSKATGGSASCLDMFAHRYGSSPLSKWPPATCLRGQCFLVGDFNQTLCVPTDGSAWLRPDSVYFTSIPLCLRLAKYRVRGGGIDGVGLFNLDTGYIERPANFRSFRRPRRSAWSRHLNDLDWSKAIWFMPSMH